MIFTPLKALALQAQVSNLPSNQTLTELESISNFPSNSMAINDQKFKKKFEIKEEHKKTVPALYLGMSTMQIIPTQRLRCYWSILGDCIDERKEFYFQCENEQEADELKKLTVSLVFQYNDRWRVDLDGLALRAEPPLEKGKTGSIIKEDESE